MTTFIYTLENPITHVIRYVGKANDTDKRIAAHLREKAHTAKCRWIQSLLRRGLKPEIKVLDEVPESEWKFWEQYWIAQLKAWGIELFNGDDGGLGSGRITKEIRQKISLTLQGRRNVKRFKSCASYDKNGFLVSFYPSFIDAAIAIKSSHSNISRAVAKKRSCAGFFWRSFVGNPEPKIETPYVNGKLPDEERRRKQSATTKGRPGKIPDQATRMKMRLARLGKSPANKGVRMNESLKAEMRIKSPRSKAVYQLTMDGIIVRPWTSIKYAAQQLGTCRSAILRCCKGIGEHAAGWKWMFACKNNSQGVADSTSAALAE